MNILRISCPPMCGRALQKLKERFGQDLHVYDVEMYLGNYPGEGVLTFLEYHPELGKIDVFEVTGPDDQLLQLTYELRDDHTSGGLVKAVYRLDPDSGQPLVVGKDDKGRDVYDFQGYVSLDYRIVRHLVETPF